MQDGYIISCGITIETAFIQKNRVEIQFWLNFFKTPSWPCLCVKLFLRACVMLEYGTLHNLNPVSPNTLSAIVGRNAMKIMLRCW
jgi:hypothetical protein